MTQKEILKLVGSSPQNNTGHLSIFVCRFSKSAYLLYIDYLGPYVYQNTVGLVPLSEILI